MAVNPYQTPQASAPDGKTRATVWLIWCGVALIGLAAICLAATIAGMMLAFDSVARSETTPDPAGLASGISLATLPSVAAAPLAVMGAILIIVGFVVRRR